MSQKGMKTSEAKDFTRRAIGLAVTKHRSKVIALLKKYGVSIDTSDKDKIIVAVLVAVRDNERFRNDLQALLTQTTSESVGFTAEYNSFFFTGAKEFFNWTPTFGSLDNSGEASTSSTSSTSTKSTAGQLLSDPKFLGSVINTGLTTLSNSLTNKSNQHLADTALQIEAEKTKQAALLAQSGGVSPGGAKGLSTGAIIAITLGSIAVVGTIIWLIVRKK